jgi:hypothetical protein
MRIGRIKFSCFASRLGYIGYTTHYVGHDRVGLRHQFRIK